MRAEAFAKVNLSLRVRRRDPAGYHPLVSWMQTISWSDDLTLQGADEDGFGVEGGAPPGEDNLAWKAILAVREAGGYTSPVRLDLAKRVPAAAGLGGGSADAATVLKLAALHYGLDPAAATGLAFGLGADVPYLMEGGLAEVTGFGERVNRAGDGDGFALAVIVPPVELSTAAVFAEWDALGGPAGEAVEGTMLPPALRDRAPFANDLYPAAVRLHERLDEWRAELAAGWSRPVLMSGSGPALFAFFMDLDEATDALGAVPLGARAAEAVVPVPRGSRIEGGTLDAPAQWGVV